MARGGFPVVLTHRDAVAMEGNDQRLASILPNAAVLLVARGADKIIVPAPSDRDRARIAAGLGGLPPERRNLVEVVDRKAELLQRVLTYLQPLHVQAKKWPEDAFVNFSVTFLYELSLGLTHGAGVISDAASVVRSFIPIIDPAQFAGEARFRLAELCRLICAYEPAVIDHGEYNADHPGAGTPNALAIMEEAEFRELVGASGRIGYLKHPVFALKRLKKHFLALMRKPLAKGAISLASTAADAAGGGGLGAASGKALSALVPESDGDFSPPFISLGAAELSLYRSVLKEMLPSATPPTGAIMAFETHFTHSWLNVGEEGKLAREAASGHNSRVLDYRRAVDAVNNLIRG